jgi:hypothetical protein
MVRPNYPPPLISLPEARAIIGGAIAYALDACVYREPHPVC